jgi:hypothetical protein
MEGTIERRRLELGDGAATTVIVVAHPAGAVRLRVVRLETPAPFDRWCAEQGVREAVSGGFSVKPEYEPLGELWQDGRPVPNRPFRAPWADRRGAVRIDADRVQVDWRDRLAGRPAGDLLQAGPLLVRAGRSVVAGDDDPEGFSSTSDEFDQDLTASREPRLALATDNGRVLLVTAEGRAPDEAGLTLHEFADALADLGAQAAVNLDGGSAGVVVTGGRRVNQPRDDEGQDLEWASESVTGIVLDPA